LRSLQGDNSRKFQIKGWTFELILNYFRQEIPAQEGFESLTLIKTSEAADKPNPIGMNADGKVFIAKLIDPIPALSILGLEDSMT
jgi:hypothetical protein